MQRRAAPGGAHGAQSVQRIHPAPPSTALSPRPCLRPPRIVCSRAASHAGTPPPSITRPPRVRVECLATSAAVHAPEATQSPPHTSLTADPKATPRAVHAWEPIPNAVAEGTDEGMSGSAALCCGVLEVADSVGARCSRRPRGGVMPPTLPDGASSSNCTGERGPGRGLKTCRGQRPARRAHSGHSSV